MAKWKAISKKAVAYRQRQMAQFQKACGDYQEPKLEYLLEHRGTKVIVTDHVRQRARERHGMPISQMKVYFQHMIDGIAETDYVPTEYNEEVFVYVRAFARGCVVAFRRDFKDQSNRDLIMAIITMYKYGQGKPAHADTEVIYV